jgi:hypothetical protein
LLFGTNLTVPFGFKSVSGLMGFFLKIFISSLDKLLLDSESTSSEDSSSYSEDIS